MSDKRESFSYISRCQGGCGGMVFAISDDLERRKGTAKEIAKQIREGYEVERVLSSAVRTPGAWGCHCEGSIESQAEKQMRLF